MKDEFCKFCDYGHNGIYDCPTDQEARIESGRCVYSTISGVKVETYLNQIRVPETGEKIPLDDDAIFIAIHQQIIANSEQESARK